MNRTRPSATACDHAGIGQHADLHRADIKIGEHRIDLRGDEIRRHIVNAGHALRVLRASTPLSPTRQDTKRREGFQVCLNAGTTTGIRACNGDGNRAS